MREGLASGSRGDEINQASKGGRYREIISRWLFLLQSDSLEIFLKIMTRVYKLLLLVLTVTCAKLF